MQLEQIITVVLEQIKRAYAFFESLNISVTSLLVITIVLALVFLFAVREAASWFFKVDALKKEMRRLRRTTEQVEEQILALQVLMTQTKQASYNVIPPFAPEDRSDAKKETPPSEKPAAQFPISR